MTDRMDKFKQRVIEDHAKAVERGEHDDQCEWRPYGFWVCNCSPRRRQAAGYTEPPGSLIYQAPLCPRCDNEVEHDGDTWTCYPCCVHWINEYGPAEFFDDHGDLTEDLAKWDARYTKSGGAS
jgi:hypothetical protein